MSVSPQFLGYGDKTPKLRFPGFFSDWERRNLCAFFTFKNGVNAEKSQYGSGYKFINVLDIIENEFITHDRIRGSVNISEKEFSKNKVGFGDVLFQRSSETREEVGQANVYLDKETPATFGGFVIMGKKITDYEPIFMNYLLKTPRVRKDITSRSGGSTRYNIGQESLQKVSVTIPPLSEQQKIAGFLGAVDAWIINLKAQHKALEAYKKGMMQKLFSQEIRFKDKNGNAFPDWEEKKLGECLDYEQPTSYIVKSTEYDNSYKIPVLTAGKSFILGHTNESDGIFQDNLPVIIFDDFTTTSQFVTFFFKVKSSAMKILKAKEGVDIKFVYESMQTIKFEIGGHGRHWISVFSKLPIPFPSYPEQQKIADFLTSIDALIDAKQTQITAAETWKKGLMQQLFV